MTGLGSVCVSLASLVPVIVCHDKSNSPAANKQLRVTWIQGGVNQRGLESPFDEAMSIGTRLFHEASGESMDGSQQVSCMTNCIPPCHPDLCSLGIDQDPFP